MKSPRVSLAAEALVVVAIVLSVGTAMAPVSAAGTASGMRSAAPAAPSGSTVAPATRPAPAPADGPAAQKEAAAKAALEWYAKAVGLYMKGDWPAMIEELKAAGKHSALLTPAQRGDLQYIRTAVAEHRPAWWGNCTRTSNTSFGARIWGRDLTINYMPSELLGAQAPVGIRDGKLLVIVSWRPSFVNSPKAIGGSQARRFGLVGSDLAEAMVWHELGHNYISTALPLNAVIELYRNHLLLFSHLTEFYADMTALAHASPKARLATLLIRTDEIEADWEDEGHARGAMAIGSLLLANFLSDANKWPSVHLPPAVPDKDVERQTIIYVYDHLDANWTLAEDRALRDLVRKVVTTKGDAIFRGKGDVPLPNNLSFKLMVSDDRELQKKRDAWVAAQLKKAIDAGRADKPQTGPTGPTGPFFRGSRVEIPW